MAVWDKKLLWLLMLTLAGAAAVSVTYPPEVCAVGGSTVTLLCSFTPVTISQGGQEVPVTIVRVVWCQNHLICHGSTPSVYDSNSTNNNPRYKYLGDKQGNCSLQISDVHTDDDAVFRFRMEAVRKDDCFTGGEGVRVRVVDGVQMKISSKDQEKQTRDAPLRGQTVTLLCTAVCSVHQLEVTWFRDGHALSQSGPALRLGPLAAKDSGNYTCGLKMNGSTRSLPYSLHVEPEDEGEGGGSLSLTVGVVSAVLLALLALVLVLCIIRRRRAAAEHRAAGRRQVEPKCPHDMYSSVPPTAKPERRARHQETGPAVEEVSYAAVQFKPMNQPRVAVEAEDSIIYSSVVSRG